MKCYFMSCIKNSTVDCFLQEKNYNSDLFSLDLCGFGAERVDLSPKSVDREDFLHT